MSGNVFNETCVVTGEPARYRDPVTGQPYATLAAFKILRERFAAEVPRGGCGASACMQWWQEQPHGTASAAKIWVSGRVH